MRRAIVLLAWALLHFASGRPVWVNTDTVNVVAQDPDGSGRTLVGFLGPANPVLVRESVDETLAALRKAEACQ